MLPFCFLWQHILREKKRCSCPDFLPGGAFRVLEMKSCPSGDLVPQYSLWFFFKKNLFLIFLPSNSGLGLILAIKFKNWVSLAIQLSKPFKFDHRTVLWVVLIFLFTIKSLDLKMIITFCPYLQFRSFPRSCVCNGEIYLLKCSSYYFIIIYYIILILLCKNNNIRKLK